MRQIRPQIDEAYEALHRVGILHNDLAPRHIRISTIADGLEGRNAVKVRLIDFEGSKDVGMEMATASEASRIKGLLGLEPPSTDDLPTHAG